MPGVILPIESQGLSKNCVSFASFIHFWAWYSSLRLSCLFWFCLAQLETLSGLITVFLNIIVLNYNESPSKATSRIWLIATKEYDTLKLNLKILSGWTWSPREKSTCLMFLFCVRVSCHEQVLYGPKWVSIEETSTLCDVLRCATGDKYLSRKLKVVVASEKSLRDLSFVKLALPVVILDKNDKKVVSFLLKPEKAVITVSCWFLIFYKYTWWSLLDF